MYHLYACGFNAHGQLNRFARGDRDAIIKHGNFPETYPMLAAQTGDITFFTPMVSAESIEVVGGCWSQIILRINDLIHILGHPLQSWWLCVDELNELYRSATIGGTTKKREGFYASTRFMCLPPDTELISPVFSYCGLESFIAHHPVTDTRHIASVILRKDGIDDKDPRSIELALLPAATRLGTCVRIAVTTVNKLAAVFVPTPETFQSQGDSIGQVSTIILSIFENTWSFIDFLIREKHTMKCLRDGLQDSNPYSLDSCTMETHSIIVPTPPGSSIDLNSLTERLTLLATACTLILAVAPPILSHSPDLSLPTEIYTLGDVRYPQALGRSITHTSPARTPGQIDTLAGLHITKVVSSGGGGGGCLAGAVTNSGEAYIWGMVKIGGNGEEHWRSFPDGHEVNNDLNNPGLGTELEIFGEGQHVVRVTLPPSLKAGNNNHIDDTAIDQDINSQEREEERDIVDMAVGDGHALVLDSHGSVWSCGHNEHGQLGHANKTIRSRWQKIELFDDMKVKGVFCYDLTSFVLVETDE